MTTTHLLSCALLIPAGLAGIGAGFYEILLASDALPDFLNHLRLLTEQFQPWLEGIFSLFIGALVLFIAALLGLRGLQS